MLRFHFRDGSYYKIIFNVFYFKPPRLISVFIILQHNKQQTVHIYFCVIIFVSYLSLLAAQVNLDFQGNRSVLRGLVLRGVPACR